MADKKTITIEFSLDEYWNVVDHKNQVSFWSTNNGLEKVTEMIWNAVLRKLGVIEEQYDSDDQ